jgi:hypothetical protein
MNDWITDEEIEQGLRENGWNFIRLGERRWGLFIQDPGRVGVYQVLVENGLSNEWFVGIYVPLLQAQQNPGCVYKALSLLNGHLNVVKFEMQDAAVVAYAAFSRIRAFSTPGKLRQQLQHAIAGVVAGAIFAQPILECCVQNEHCDPEEELRRRMAQFGQGRPNLGLAPPRP